MRFAGVLLALLVLAGCEQAPTQTGVVRSDAAKVDPAADAGLTPAGTAFDYRYAFRLSPARIEPVQESHARGCDQLGPSRCRITAMQYKVGADNKIVAVLTLKLDPALARAFGKAATTTVISAKGVLIDAEIAGADSLAASGRSDTIVAKLRDSLSNADAQVRGPVTPEQRAQITAKTIRLRAAIATIDEVEQGAGTSAATTPVIFTYSSGGPIPGLGGSSEASFDAAGQTFLQSISGLANVLAGVGPWALLLIGGALILRRLVNPEVEAAPQLPVAAREPGEHRSLLQRWLRRGDPEPAG